MDDKLAALSRKQDTSSSTAPRFAAKAWLFKFLPWLVGAAALLLAILLFGERFLPATTVQVETVVTARADTAADSSVSQLIRGSTSDPFAGSALFQASGWFEADPYPYRATALASGVVETVHVLEGQAVQTGQPLATLIQEDASLRLQTAQANVSAARASVEEARRAFALGTARIDSMRHQVDVAEARGEELADLASRAHQLGPEVMAEQDIVQAELRLQTQLRTIDSLKAQLRERIIESERLGEQITVMEGLLSQSEVRLQEAQLEFDRTVIRSPVDGIVQRLMVAPGQKKILMADNPESATVALLFQPEHMQARIDVPIAEAARLRLGQAVLLESEFLPGLELQGRVQRINGEADLQRNTLQVKVRIIEPAADLRPEILCRARFLDTAVAGTSSSGSSGEPPAATASTSTGLMLMIPRTALIPDTGGLAAVWAVDGSGNRIEKRSVRLSGEPRDGYVPVADGLRPGDRVVVNPPDKLREGSRIQY